MWSDCLLNPDLVSQCTICLCLGFRMHNVLVVWFQTTKCADWFQKAHCACSLVSGCMVCLWLGLRMHDALVAWFQNAQCAFGLVLDCKVCC